MRKTYRKATHKTPPVSTPSMPRTKQDLDTLVNRHMEDLITDLQNGNGERLTAYLEWNAAFHKYSLGNQAMIREQMPNATRVAGFKTWSNMGQAIKPRDKGGKGIAIWGFGTRERDKRTKTNLAKPEGEREKETAVYFPLIYVWDISQLDPERASKPLPQFWTPLGNDGLALYEALVRAATKDGRVVREDEVTGRIGQDVEGWNHQSLIVINALLDPTNKFLTGLHEWAHSLLHWDENRTSLSRQQKECQAEATAYIVAAHFGIKSPMSADYVRSWSQTPESLRAELDAVRGAAKHIIDLLEAETGGQEEEEETE